MRQNSNGEASDSDWWKMLAGSSKIMKKRTIRKRASLKKLIDLSVMIRVLKKCSSTVWNISWMNLKRGRSNTSIKRRTDFSYPFAPYYHNADRFLQVYQRKNKMNKDQNVHSPILSVDHGGQDDNLSRDQNGGPDDGLETEEAISPNKDLNNRNKINVLAPPTPDIEAKHSDRNRENSDFGHPYPANTNAKTTSNCGISESLIDILKKKCSNGLSEKNSRKRMKVKRYKPKVFVQRKFSQPSTPKPRTPKQRRENVKKTTKKVKRKLDFDDDKEELKPKSTSSTSEVESKPMETKSMDTSLGFEAKFPTTCRKKRLVRQRVSRLKLTKLIKFIRKKSSSEKDGVEMKKLDLNPRIQDEAFKAALVDFLVKRMDSLHIDDVASKQVAVLDPNNCGTLVDLKRKRKKKNENKPKIDLDTETIRVWNLLEQNKWSESAEAEGSGDPEHMKGQRKIFREKIDMFLARMHVIQGDRTFSPWKGSVLDSIAGVFLTQNVCDSLSSNAFMDLVSAYPPLSLSEQNAQYSRDYRQLTLGEPVSDMTEEESSPTTSQTSPSRYKKNKKPSTNKKNKKESTTNWDELRTQYSRATIRTNHNADTVNWERIRQAPREEVAGVIAKRGMNNQLTDKIKEFLDRLVKDHGSMDIEWLRNVPPEKAKDFLMSVFGLGLKSTECVRLLSLHFHAFPIDTNAGRFFVRVGWVPIKPLPGGLEFHLLNEYPLLDSVQKYMWPRICDRDMLTLYDLHCHSITFAKSFCTKTQPNCNECPMRGECRHYASAFVSAKGRLEGSETKSTASGSSPMSVPMLTNSNGNESKERYCIFSEPIVELPTSPEPEQESTSPLGGDIEEIIDWACDIPTIKLNGREFSKRIQSVINNGDGMSKALVALSPQVASIPMPKIKFSIRLRTVHQVYELPDLHPLLAEYEVREPEDPCPYLLAIWIADETSNTSNTSQGLDKSCDAGSSKEVTQYHKHDTVKGTILIPCRTANRGRFPLNGTYFQNNEVFADHEGSLRPIDVPTEWIWNLTKRTLYCGTTIASICKGMTMEETTYCFRRSYICIRGFSREKRRPMMLKNKFHLCRSRDPNETA